MEPATGTLFCLLLPSVDSACFETFLQELRTAFDARAIGVVLDNAPSHHSRQVSWPEGLVPIHLPPYSPELNPAEQLFRSLRQQLANRVFPDLDALEEALVKTLQPLWARAEVIMRLTAYPWWITGIDGIASPTS